MICRNCRSTMNSVVSGNSSKVETFYRCRSCRSETKRTPLFFNQTRNDNKNLTERGNESEYRSH